MQSEKVLLTLSRLNHSLYVPSTCVPIKNEGFSLLSKNPDYLLNRSQIRGYLK